MINGVRKRAGYVQKFDHKKLKNSLHRAVLSAKVKKEGLHELLAHDVLNELKKKKRLIVSTDDIRECVDKVLKKRKLRKVQEAYSMIWLHIKKSKLKKVIKKSGNSEDFDSEKLFKSIHKAMRSVKVHDDDLCIKITRDTIKLLEKHYHKRPVPTDVIKETATFVLTKEGLSNIAKRYVLHRYL